MQIKSYSLPLVCVSPHVLSPQPILECDEAAKDIDKGDEVEIDFDTGVITNKTKGHTYQAQPFPEFIKEIIAAGGLLNSLKK